MSYTIVNNNNITHLKTISDNTIDAIITDPPYGIEFLGKDWDSNTGAVETWEQCLRVLKPGGYLLAFSAARTYHNLATNIEGVGFEIRDQLMWLYASGFPKAQDIGKAIQKRQGVEKSKPQDGLNAFGLGGANVRMNPSMEKEYTDKKAEVIPTSPQAKQWAGWKTALKPSHEPIVMARKPFRGSTIDNVLTHGTGALNIDASRIPYVNAKDVKSAHFAQCPEYRPYDPEQQIDYKVEGGVKNRKMFIPDEQGRFPSNVIGEVAEGYQKYFYCPKVSRRERHTGFEQTETVGDMVASVGGYFCDENGNKTDGGNMIWLPDVGKIYVHGLKHEVEKIRKNKDPLSHIPTSDGGFLGTDGEWATEHWHGKNGQKNKDPLAHIPSNPSGMYEQDERGKCGTRYEARVEKERTKKDPLAHIPAPFGDVKGCYQNGERFAAVYQKLQDPLAHIDVVNQGKADGGLIGPDGKMNHHRASQIQVGNNHPTVKPVELMKYLIKLVTPPNSKVLDPFCGSGSTGMAAVELGHEFIGIDLDANYCEIAKKRIEGWNKPQETGNTYNDLFEENNNG